MIWRWFRRPHRDMNLPEVPPDIFPDEQQEHERKHGLVEAALRNDEAERRLRELEQLRPIEYEQSLIRRKRPRFPI